MPHSTLTRDWTSRDLSLAMADLLARDDIGPCGHPHSETTRPENAERYTVDDSLVCAACAVHAKHERDHEGQRPPGQILRVLDRPARVPDAEGTEFGPVFE